MDKQSLKRDISQHFGGAGLITVTQFGKYCGDSDHHTTQKRLEGLEYTTTGKKKLYFVDDIAQRLLDLRGK